MKKSIAPQTHYKPEVKRSKGISPLWILPIITLLLAAWLVIKAINDAGERVQIYFSDAQGLISGRTTIRYQGLEVGIVRDIKLSEGLENIYVEADIYPEATPLLGKNTRFWLVKPTASISGVSGLDTLVSGNYIAILPKENDAKEHNGIFTALDNAPADLLPKNGLVISLKAHDLGGISIGSQIVYKKIPIGEVFSYQLDQDAKLVNIQAVIKEEYRHIITSQSRFWNVSGVGANIGFGGVDVRFDSLSALLGGSIAVDSPDGGEVIEENTLFTLYRDLKTAGRGIPVNIALPAHHKISSMGAPIMYRGIEIGQITNLQLSEDRTQVIASAAVQPAFSDMLNSGSHFILEEAKASIAGVENVSNLFKGNYLTLIPGEGERARDFTAIRQFEFDQSQSKSVAITLVSDSAYGLSAGSEIVYKGVKVGSVINVNLKQEQVELQTLIDNEFASLIRSKNRFFVVGAATANLTESGINLSVPPIKQLLTGSISFVSEGEEVAAKEYKLYQNQSLAALATYNQSGSRTIKLYADTLPQINEGSPLLFRNLEVGRVANFKLTNDGVQIELNIENQYFHLINKQTVFWNRSGIEVNASLSEINITAAPLKTLIQGGIAFDTLPGTNSTPNGRRWLYDSYEQAKKFGVEITLTAESKLGIIKGTPIKYNNIQVGEVISASPNFSTQTSLLKAKIHSEYAKDIARVDSRFWLAKAQISVNGIENIQSLISTTIEVKPGTGNAGYAFKLAEAEKHSDGLILSLQSERRGSVAVGTPVFYREIEVGKVNALKLGELSDRILFTVEIDRKYAYLVRQNSVFWNVSGLDVSIGLTGANISAGTLDSIVRGGIAFTTPETDSLSSMAKHNQAFYLHAQAKPEWTEWKMIIPKP